MSSQKILLIIYWFSTKQFESSRLLMRIWKTWIIYVICYYRFQNLRKISKPGKLKIDFVKSCLLDEFTKRKQSDGIQEAKSTNSVAMNASKSNFKFKCYRCQKVGHKMLECRSKLMK